MKNKSIVIAIDFGTSCSGFSYVFTKDGKKSILTLDDWEGGGILNKKTVTQIVLNEMGKLEAFGYEARDYFDTHDVDPKLFPIFSLFKMHLYDGKNRAQLVKSKNSDVFVTVQTLITESLRFLKDRAIKKVQSRSCHKILLMDIQWVITIPAIWDDSCKQIMRNCSYEAGLCSKDDKDSLTFVYEPEAGALECIFEKTCGYSVSVGNKFMVIDNGGGTSDIIVYEQLENKKLKAISNSIGGDYGSIYVNINFFNFLIDVFGNEIIKRTNHPQFQVLMDKFESLKRSFKSFDSTSIMAIELNSIVVFGKDQEWLESKITAYNKRTGSELTYSSRLEKLIIPFNLFLSFFTPLFKKITDLIKSEIKSNNKLQKLDFIFLIGGFNESIHLQEHLKKKLSFTGAKFIISSNPSLAVVRGASRFGLDPNIISQRSQTKSYATQIEEEVEPGRHIGKKLINRGGTKFCPNVCDVFVHAKQMVGLDEVFIRSYVPSSVGQKSIEISIFSSHMPTMDYTTDPGVHFIGELFLVIPNPDAPIKENRIDVSMKFASTELQVSAIHFHSGESVSALFDFVLDEKESLRRNELYQIKNQPKVQLCIMMDCTGSMAGWMKESKNKMIELTQLLSNEYFDIELKVAFVGYRDIKDTTRFEIEHFTTDMVKLQNKIGSMEANGGYDGPEDIAGALSQANSLPWKNDYTKLIVHVADAPCHGTKYHDLKDDYPEGDPTGLVPEKILQVLSGKGIDYYFIKISSDTDKMINIFKEHYDTPQKKIVVQNLGSDVSKLLPSLFNFVTNSITRFNAGSNKI